MCATHKAQNPAVTEPARIARDKIVETMAFIQTLDLSSDIRTRLQVRLQTIANCVNSLDESVGEVKKLVDAFFEFPDEENTNNPMDELDDARDALANIGNVVRNA